MHAMDDTGLLREYTEQGSEHTEVQDYRFSREAIYLTDHWVSMEEAQKVIENEAPKYQ